MAEFMDTMRSLRQGAAVGELSDEMTSLVQAVQATGRPGSITLTIKVKPFKGDTSVLTVEDSITVKTPKPEKGASILYADARGNLSRKDPRQPDLRGLRTPSTVSTMPSPAEAK